jgi:hypothetical protein
MSRLISAVMAFALVATSLVAQSTKFEPKCPWPFNEDAARRPFDDLCNEGKTTDPGSIAQNVAKDNFCVVGTPVTIDIPTLKKLQAEVESPSVLGPKYQPPTDRSKLQNLSTKAPDGTGLGEGRLVQMVTFIFEAHYSDVKSGESVNCKLPSNENNDIHMALVGSPGEKDECQSVTTEITPHFRPAVWTDVALNALKGKPVRITGQLFFDASHHPGSGSNCQPPKRQSSWEIHPLYKLEVCVKTTLEECKANDNAAWVSLSVFNRQPPPPPPPPDAKKKDEGTTQAGASASSQSQWETTLAYPYTKGDGTLSVRYKGDIVALKVDEKALGKTASNLEDFSEGDTIWLRVSPDRTSLVRVDCVPVPGGVRLAALAIPAAALILLTIVLSWGGALHFLMGADGHYSKSKFQLAVWFGVLVTAYLATHWLRWRYGLQFGGIGIPAHLALISGISAFTFAAAKSIAVTKKPQDGAAVGAQAPPEGAIVPAPPQPVAPPKGAAQRWTFIRDLLSDDAGNAELGDYQMLVIVLIAVGTYLFQMYHFLGTINFADVTLPDVDSTILAAFGLGQGAYLGNKVASDGKPPEKK